MTTTIPHFDNRLAQAVYSAERAGKIPYPLIPLYAESLISDFRGDNPPTVEELTGAKSVEIGGNSDTSWIGIITATGRHFLWVVSSSYDGERDAYSEEIFDGGPFPSYIGHY